MASLSALNLALGQFAGLQLGAINWAHHAQGVQLAPLNLAEELDGLQLGVLNLASGRVHGLQLGLFNYADEASPRPLLLALSLVLSLAPRALAHDVQVSQGPSAQIVQTVPAEPQVIDYGEPSELGVSRHSLRDLLAGSLVGAGAGYLSSASSGADEPWRDIVLGSGIGALTGAGIGLSLGLLDAADGFRSPTRYVMRDALYGTALGGVFGSIAGGLVALNSADAEDIMVGASIGSIAGVVLGSIVGVIEGQWRPRLRPARVEARPRARERRNVSTTIVVSQDSAGQRLLMPSVQGTF